MIFNFLICFNRKFDSHHWIFKNCGLYAVPRHLLLKCPWQFISIATICFLNQTNLNQVSTEYLLIPAGIKSLNTHYKLGEMAFCCTHLASAATKEAMLTGCTFISLTDLIGLWLSNQRLLKILIYILTFS